MQDLVWCIDSPGFGGSERDLLRVMQWASPVSRRQTLVHANPLDPRLQQALAERGLETWRIESGSRITDLPRVWRSADPVVAAFRGARWIVWCHHYDTCRWLQLRLALSGERFVLAERNMASTRSGFRRSRLTVPLKWLVGRRGISAILPGHAQVPIYESYFGVPANKVRCVPNSRDIETIAARAGEIRNRAQSMRVQLGLPLETAVVCCVGRLADQKGQDVLVHAVGTLRQGGLMIHLCLIGEGPDAARLRGLCEQFLPGSYSILGERPDPVPFLAVADVFALASRYEGLPGALVEAMAAGVPIVASAIPGNEELVDHERTGLLFPVDDGKAAAQAIKRLLDDRKLAEHCAHAAYQRVRLRYDSSIEREGWLALFKEME